MATRFSETPSGSHNFLNESKWIPQGEAEGLRPRSNLCKDSLFVVPRNTALSPRPSRNLKIDAFVRSPSVALYFNFVVAAHLVSAFPSSLFARLAFGAFYETIVLVTFYEIITTWSLSGA